MKQCTNCGTTHPLEDFGNKGRYCRECRRSYQRDWYKRKRMAAGFQVRTGREHWRLGLARIATKPRQVKGYRPVIVEFLLRRSFGIPICGICGDLISGEEIQIDHIVALAVGGSDTLENLQLSHKCCNLQKGIYQDP